MKTVDEQLLFRSLYESAPDAVIASDDQGRIIAANPSALRLFGYSLAALREMKVSALLGDRREGVRRDRPARRARRKGPASPSIAPRAVAFSTAKPSPPRCAGRMERRWARSISSAM